MTVLSFEITHILLTSRRHQLGKACFSSAHPPHKYGPRSFQLGSRYRYTLTSTTRAAIRDGELHGAGRKLSCHQDGGPPWHFTLWRQPCSPDFQYTLSLTSRHRFSLFHPDFVSIERAWNPFSISATCSRCLPLVCLRPLGVTTAHCFRASKGRYSRQIRSRTSISTNRQSQHRSAPNHHRPCRRRRYLVHKKTLVRPKLQPLLARRLCPTAVSDLSIAIPYNGNARCRANDQVSIFAEQRWPAYRCF